MSRRELGRQFRKMRLCFACSVVLLCAIFPRTTRAQQAPAKSSASLQTMAQDLAKELSSHKNLKVVILDFGAPAKRWLPFGAYLADQFAVELAKTPNKLSMIDRSQLPLALHSLNLKPEAELDRVTTKRLRMRSAHSA